MEIEDLITRLEQAVADGEITRYVTGDGWQPGWRDLCQEALIAIRGMQRLLPVNKTFNSHEVVYHGWVTCKMDTDIVDGVQFKRNSQYEGELHRHGSGTAFVNRKWVVWDKYGVSARCLSVVEFERSFIKGELAKELPENDRQSD